MYDAGSPTVAHTAVVTFSSSDGKTQFNFVFQLSADGLVQSSPLPSHAEPDSGRIGTGWNLDAEPQRGAVGPGWHRNPGAEPARYRHGREGGPSPIPTVAFDLLAALGTLGWVNVKSVRSRA